MAAEKQRFRCHFLGFRRTASKTSARRRDEGCNFPGKPQPQAEWNAEVVLHMVRDETVEDEMTSKTLILRWKQIDDNVVELENPIVELAESPSPQALTDETSIDNPQPEKSESAPTVC